MVAVVDVRWRNIRYSLLKDTGVKEELGDGVDSFSRREVLLFLRCGSSMRKSFSRHLVPSPTRGEPKHALSIARELIWVEIFHYPGSLDFQHVGLHRNPEISGLTYLPSEFFIHAMEFSSSWSNRLSNFLGTRCRPVNLFIRNHSRQRFPSKSVSIEFLPHPSTGL